MNLLIFKTDIKSKKKINALRPALNDQTIISNWNIDHWDIDNVLRVEANDGITEMEIIELVRAYGFYCELLTD